ncbi:hypothetical protein M8C21_025960 [Ambrosia artemisiifolia]|uniref:protein-serine/threonine phosphatase n=1 Tax=Ambrosia artemisiifolia TaxID=4212 RepID=A0AAD5DBL2_AMBAR|nr:hypothetical protein M8C21_025960 [Ambrosia artemisiifolia]
MSAIFGTKEMRDGHREPVVFNLSPERRLKPSTYVLFSGFCLLYFSSFSFKVATLGLLATIGPLHGFGCNGLLWYKDVGQHLTYSGPFGTFIGVYDGHGGPETSRYVNDHLFQNLKRLTSEQQSMSVDVIQRAFRVMEEGFLSIVARQWTVKPQLAAVGSCCLVGVLSNGTPYIAHAGDSHAVLGRAVKATGEVIAIQLSAEHNASIESIRQELHSLHPDDPQIVVLKHNV